MNNSTVNNDSTNHCAFLSFSHLRGDQTRVGFSWAAGFSWRNPASGCPSSSARQWMSHLARVLVPTSLTGNEDETWTPQSHCPSRRPLTSHSKGEETPRITFCNTKGNPPISGHPLASQKALPHPTEIAEECFLIHSSVCPQSCQKSSLLRAAAASTRHGTS